MLITQNKLYLNIKIILMIFVLNTLKPILILCLNPTKSLLIYIMGRNQILIWLAL